MQEAQERMLDKNHERPVESGVSCSDFCEFISADFLNDPVFRKLYQNLGSIS